MRRNVLLWLAAALLSSMPIPVRADGIQSDVTQNGVRQIRGTLAEVRFQIALPLSGSGRTLVYVSPHYLATETSSDTLLKPLALARGWVYVASDEGDDQTSVKTIHAYEVRRAILDLVGLSKHISRRQYGHDPERTYIAGYSLGGHTAKWMIEQSDVFDGALALAPSTSVFEVLRWFGFFNRTYNGSAESVTTFPAVVDGFPFDLGIKPAYGPPKELNTLQGYAPALVEAAIKKFSPGYSGNVKEWDADTHIPAGRIRDLRRFDETGWLRIGDRKAPLIILHGASDAFVPVGASIAYRDLVKQMIGPDNVDAVLRVFIIPEFTHLHFFEGGSPDDVAAGLKLTDEALTALDKWLNEGQAPESIGGITLLK